MPPRPSMRVSAYRPATTRLSRLASVVMAPSVPVSRAHDSPSAGRSAGSLRASSSAACSGVSCSSAMSRGCGSTGSGEVMAPSLAHPRGLRPAKDESRLPVGLCPADPGHCGPVSSSTFRAERPVPVRTILVTIGLLLATALALYILLHIRQVLTWIVVGAFFAVALYPVVG